jgi:transcriptional regulator with XRE-family HTH domain
MERDESHYSLIGQRIREARRACRLTLQQLASSLGVGPGTVDRWEKGRRRISVADLEAIADLLCFPYQWFLGIEIPQTDVIPALRADSSLSPEDRRVLEELVRFYRSRYRRSNL